MSNEHSTKHCSLSNGNLPILNTMMNATAVMPLYVDVQLFSYYGNEIC